MFTITNGIILKGHDLTLKKENIVVDEGKIVEIGKESAEGKIIDVDGAVVCPSFINGHTHIGDSIIKDEGYSLSLSEMVKPPNGVKHKALANADDEELISAMKSTMWEMVESGITHFIDYREGGIKGVELLKKAAEENGFNNLKVINSNWCELKGKLEFGAWDVVTCNPPYKKAEAGITNENEARRIARHETGTTLSDVCKAAASLLRSGGKFYMCHRPERLCDIICDMRSVNIEPKRIRFVHQRLNTEPWLVLVEGRRDGKSGIRVDNPLYIEWDNEPSKEMEEIYGVYRDGKGSEE